MGLIRDEKKIAILSVSRKGTELSTRLQGLLENCEIYAPAKFSSVLPTDSHLFDGRIADHIPNIFQQYQALIAVMSLGAAIRLIAPSIRSKHTDPAVVVVDDNGHFVISTLSGHLGGANALTKKIAEIIGAEEVITTASDLANTVHVDLLGQELGWEIESWEGVTTTSAAVVNGEVVAIYQDSGERDWWPGDREIPENIHIIDSLDVLPSLNPKACMLITDRLITNLQTEIQTPTVIYRPKTLVIGIGCNRGTESSEIEDAVTKTLSESNLSFKSVRNVATIDLKSDEPGLVHFAERLGLPIQFYSADQLNAVTDLPNPSQIVMSNVGTRGVCEPAALLSSMSNELLLDKQKIGNVTVAVARVSFG